MASLDSDSYLDNLAKGFEDRIRATAHGSGWGQFLDGPVGHEQIGPYGTAAGAIVRALAGRGADAVGRDVETLLTYWLDPEAPNYTELWPQTVRLAFVYMSLRLACLAPDKTQALRAELIRRRLPGGLWGNYWCDQQNHDPSPRTVPSSLILLSLALLTTDEEIDDVMRGQADLLESRLGAGTKLSQFERAIAGAALLSIKRGGLGKTALGHLRSLAFDLPKGPSEQGVYFYEYRPLEAQQDAAAYPRDYLIIPVAMAAAIAGLQFGAPPELRLRAMETAQQLTEELSIVNMYRPSPETRIASKNQAWAALVLALARRAEDRAWPAFASWRVSLFRRRQDNRWTSVGLPLVTWSAAIAAAVMAPEVGLLGRLVLAAVALMAGGLYPPTKLLPRWAGRPL